MFKVREKRKRGYFKFMGYRFNTERHWWGDAITSISGPHPLKWWKRVEWRRQR